MASWVGAVAFVNGKVPGILLNLTYPRGKKRFIIETQNQEGILGADQIVEKNKLPHPIALTEAKLDRLGASKLAHADEQVKKKKEMHVLELMDDVYPAISFQIDELHKELKKVQEEALSDNRKEVSLQNILKELGVKGMLKLISAITILSLVLAACNTAKTPAAATPKVENRPTVTQPEASPTQIEPTAANTPEPTEIPMGQKPDFESMTEDERLQFMEEWGMFLADQVDCSPGTQGLPAPTSTPELLGVDQNERAATWRTEYLGSYEVPLNDKNNLPIGYVRCFYFASSAPGGIFTVWGGGEIWGGKMKSFINDVDGGLEMNPGSEYEVTLPTEVLDRWSSVSATSKKLLIQTYYSHGDIMMVVAGRVRSSLESKLIHDGYPQTNTSRLISNTKVPVEVVYNP